MLFTPIVSEPFFRYIRQDELLFAEAPLLEKYPKYLAFYQFRPATHDLILDNGAALTGSDGPMHIGGLMRLAALVGADEIVVPDVMYEHDKTLELAQVHLPSIGASKAFVVPQGRTTREWLHCASEMIQKYRFAVLGVPKHLSQHPGGRIHALAQLKERFPQIGTKGYPAVHLLGIWGDPIEVLFLARAFPWVRSVDSSLPCAYGQNGYSNLVGWAAKGKVPFQYRTGGDFKALWSTAKRGQIHAHVAANLAQMRRWADGGSQTYESDM